MLSYKMDFSFCACKPNPVTFVFTVCSGKVERIKMADCLKMTRKVIPESRSWMCLDGIH